MENSFRFVLTESGKLVRFSPKTWFEEYVDWSWVPPVKDLFVFDMEDGKVLSESDVLSYIDKSCKEI